MKLSLVVAEGVHQGKVIPVTVSEFLIGRDPECQLRPASPQVSKKHCAVVVRQGKVYVRDFGSTNGTFVNGEQVAGEREVVSGDALLAGPLSFHIQFEVTKPVASKSASEAKPVASKSASEAKPVASKSASEAKPVAAPVAVAQASGNGSDEGDDSEKLAAMLLNDDDGDSSASDQTTEQLIPDGTTVMELPSVTGAQSKDKKQDPNTADTSGAARALLQKYLKRPRS